jgi:hypothetical protein
MPSIDSQLAEPKPRHHRFQYGLRSLLLVTIGVALVLPLALSSELMMMGVPFLACSIIGALLGSRQLRRMVLYSALGGVVGGWLGEALTIVYRADLREYSENVARHGRLYFYLMLFNILIFFFQGAMVGPVVWLVQVIRAKFKAK